MVLVQLIPGEWYLILTCPRCLWEHIEVDPTKGSTIDGASTTCPHCQNLIPHSDRRTQRYEHADNGHNPFLKF